MAASGFTPLSLYYSVTPTNAPTSGNLVNGELAINITDGKLFYKDSGGVVQVIAGKGGAGIAAGSNTQVQYNSSGSLAGSANLTFNGTTLTSTGFSGPLGATTPSTVVATTINASGIANITYSDTASFLSGLNVTNTGNSAQSQAKIYAINNAGDYLSIGRNSTLLGGNSQIYSTGAYPLDFFTNGTKQATIDASGNVGIGVTPSAWLASYGYKAIDISNGGVSAGTSFSAIGYNYYVASSTDPKYKITGLASKYSQDAGVHSWHIAPSGTAGNTITFSQAMTLDASGNLGVGTSSPSAKLDVAGVGNYFSTSANNYVSVTATGVSNTVFGFNNSGSTVFGVTNNTSYFGNRQSYPISFIVNETERMRIDSSGNLLVGTTSNINTSTRCNITTASDWQLALNATSTTGVSTLTFSAANVVKTQLFQDHNLSRFYVINNTVGVYISLNGSSWTSNSDERKKDIIEPITDAANKVSTLRAVIGKYKTDEEGTRRSFLIAQDVLAVLPEAVDATDPDDLGVQYTDTIPLLVAAIQELKAIIDLQQTQITALNAKVGI